MAEWIFELGIGEARAALVADGEIVEMAIDRDDGRLRAGAVVPVRLVRIADATGRGLAELPDGSTARLERLPRGITEGMTIAAEVLREAIDEGGGHVKPPRLAVTEAAPRPGPTLAERIALTGLPVRRGAAHLPDALEAAGWSEAIEEAASGLVARDAAMLRIVPTPAMTLIDVDGASAPEDLAVAGAVEAGRAIRRLDIGGSIGIDLPTIEGKAARQAAAAALDAVLPPPFERTAVNGFGFLQIVRRRARASIVELLRHDPVTAAACALLRRGERVAGAGGRDAQRRAARDRADRACAAVGGNALGAAGRARRLAGGGGDGHIRSRCRCLLPALAAPRAAPIAAPRSTPRIRPSAARDAAIATCCNGWTTATASPALPPIRRISTDPDGWPDILAGQGPETPSIGPLAPLAGQSPGSSVGRARD